MPIKRTLDRAITFARRRGIKATVAEVAARASRRLEAGDMPPSVHVEVSSVCNLHCEYCVLDSAPQRVKIMDDATFDLLLPELSHARRIDLSGLAEPLMNKRFLGMLERARAAAPKAHIAMCTNATLLTEEISEKLVEFGLDELVFSLDGVDPAQVDAVRRGGSLDTVLCNIRILQQVKARAGSSRPELSATVVLQHDNVADLPGVIRLAAELGCTGVSVNGLEPYSDELTGAVVWSHTADTPALAEALLEAGRVAEEVGIDLRLPAMSPQRPVCPQIDRPIVLPSGDVIPCSVLAYERRSLLAIDAADAVTEQAATTHELCFGNVAQGGLSAIWNSLEYRTFRARVRKGDFPAECASCLLKHDVICPVPPLTAEQSVRTIPDA